MELFIALAFLTVFVASALGGITLRGCLHERHLTAENMEAIRLVTGLMVTFAALVLSLQLSSARTNFDQMSRTRSIYAAQLSNLGQCLHALGPSAAPIRILLRQYVAAAIASTWPNEPYVVVGGMPNPAGMAVQGADMALTKIMSEIGQLLDGLRPTDAAASNTISRCRADYASALSARWNVIEYVHLPSQFLFMSMLGFWLALVFLSFGLQIARRVLSAIVLAIGVISVSTVMFVITDLCTPYGGVFSISSETMRDALAELSE